MKTGFILGCDLWKQRVVADENFCVILVGVHRKGLVPDETNWLPAADQACSFVIVTWIHHHKPSRTGYVESSLCV